MFKQKYVWRNADKYGFSGLLAVGQIDADPTLSPAHDFFDHEGLPRTNDCYTNEFIAIGTSVALRIVHEPATHAQVKVVADYIESVIDNMCANFERYVGVEAMQLTTKTRAISDSDYGEYPETLLKSALDLAVAGVVAKSDLAMKANIKRILTEQGLDSILSYLRRGYRRAISKFGNYDIKELGSYLFNKLDRTVRTYFENKPMVDGQAVTVFVNPKKREIRIHVDGKLHLVA